MATDEAQAFYNAVYSVVRLIPKGQVTTYGTSPLNFPLTPRTRRETN